MWYFVALVLPATAAMVVAQAPPPPLCTHHCRRNTGTSRPPQGCSWIPSQLRSRARSSTQCTPCAHVPNCLLLEPDFCSTEGGHWYRGLVTCSPAPVARAPGKRQVGIRHIAAKDLSTKHIDGQQREVVDVNLVEGRGLTAVAALVVGGV